MGNQEIEIKTSESHFMNDDLFRTFCFKSIYYYCYCFWNCFCEFEILIFFHRHNNGRAKPHQTLNSCVIHAIVNLVIMRECRRRRNKIKCILQR